MDHSLPMDHLTHSCILAWVIAQTEEPHGLQSLGPQESGHDLATEHAYIIKVRVKCGDWTLLIHAPLYSQVGLSDSISECHESDPSTNIRS